MRSSISVGLRWHPVSDPEDGADGRPCSLSSAHEGHAVRTGFRGFPEAVHGMTEAESRRTGIVSFAAMDATYCVIWVPHLKPCRIQSDPVRCGAVGGWNRRCCGTMKAWRRKDSGAWGNVYPASMALEARAGTLPLPFLCGLNPSEPAAWTSPFGSKHWDGWPSVWSVRGDPATAVAAGAAASGFWSSWRHGTRGHAALVHAVVRVARAAAKRQGQLSFRAAFLHKIRFGLWGLRVGGVPGYRWPSSPTILWPQSKRSGADCGLHLWSAILTTLAASALL